VSLALRKKKKKSVLHKLLSLTGIVLGPDLDVSIALWVFFDRAGRNAAMTDCIKRACDLDASNPYLSQDRLRISAHNDFCPVQCPKRR
jgi:hypothetical protein